MVDFQSRTTRRGTDDEDEEGAESEAEAEPEETESTGENGTPEPAETETESVEQFPDTFTYAVVTVNGQRTLEDDATGNVVVEAVEQAGDAVATRELIPPSYDGVQTTLDTLAGRGDVDTIVTVGGTGVEPDDVTVDAATDLFERELPGFGELFRVLSHDHEGTAVVRTRTTAGLVDETPVFCLPGETVAARRGVEQIVLAEAPELATLAASPTSPETENP